MSGETLWLHGLRRDVYRRGSEVEIRMHEIELLENSKGLLALDGACAGLRLLEDDQSSASFAS